ncbi:hypothetical protein ACFL1Z_00770 [Thermodesulfobacteriota bacterium]
MDECAKNRCATARCRPEAEADNRGVADGARPPSRFSGTTEDGKTGNLMGPLVYPWGSTLLLKCAPQPGVEGIP